MTSINGVNLMSLYGGQAALSLFTGRASTNIVSTSNDTLLSYLQAKEGLGAGAGANADGTTTPTGPTAPWDATNGAPSISDAVSAAIAGQSFIDPGKAVLDAPGGISTPDYKNLFALYQGLLTLGDIAQTASTTGTAAPSTQPAQLQAAFASGLSQVQDFLATSPFKGFNLTTGKVNTSLQSTVGIANGAALTYSTGAVFTGDRYSPMAALGGAVQFTVSVKNKYLTNPATVNIDLSGMGSRPRTLDNTVNYINAQLKAAGVQTTFAVASLGNVPQPATSSAGGVKPTPVPQWGLTINASSAETVSFSAPSTAAAVYVSEATGGAKTYTGGSDSTTPAAQQLIKLQTDNDIVGTPPAANTTKPTDTSLPVGGVFSTALPAGVVNVKASATGADGSLYLVADATGTAGSNPVPGQQGVALFKYDSAGKLLYTKVLGGAQDASGYSVAVGAAGAVAVAGSNTIAASTSVSGVATAAKTSAMVQVFDATGVPSWSKTISASGGTAAASGVTFGSDGSVYLSGTTTGSVNGQLTHGASDEFIQGYTAAGVATFTTQFGTTGDNTSAGLAYDANSGSLFAAGTENGKAVVRSYALNGIHAPGLTATRTLGGVENLVGVAVTGGRVVVGGNVAAATINAGVGSVGQAYAGVSDGFVASLSTDLQPASTDVVNYMGGAGETTKATALAVGGGQAYLTGTVLNDVHGPASSGSTEGFVTGVDTSSGAVSYSKTFATNGQAAPSAIAVATAGASVLDRLGLPNGRINAAGSSLITANTPIKAGDSFYIRTSPKGAQQAITISAKDTLATLADKLNAAIGGTNVVTVLPLSTGSELEISPTQDSYLELDAQPDSTNVYNTAKASSTDVLAALGLSAGVVRQVKTVNGGLTDVTQLREYGLGLRSNLSIGTPQDAAAALKTLQGAMGVIHQAYQDLVNPPTIASEAMAAAKNASGSVPAYLTAQIANYQAGLNRLLGTG